jgi:hypothetical protein
LSLRVRIGEGDQLCRVERVGTPFLIGTCFHEAGSFNLLEFQLHADNDLKKRSDTTQPALASFKIGRLKIV